MPASDASVDSTYVFGPFRLDPREAALFRGAEVVALTPKVFDTLLVLVEQAGRVVSRDTLMEKVWPDSVVSDSTLSQNIWVLRTTLGEDETTKYIETVPRRGYRFIAPVTRENVGAAGLAPPGSHASGGASPAAPTVHENVKRLAANDELYSQEFVVIRRRRSSRRFPLAWIAAAVAISVVITALVMWLVSRRSVPPARVQAPAPELLPIEDYVTEIAISPDGKQFAYVARDSQDRCALFLRQRGAAQTSVPLEKDAADIRRLAFSPDGSTLTYQRLGRGQQTEYALFARSLATGEKRQLIGGIMTAAAAPRSRAILYVPESTTEQALILRGASQADRRILTIRSAGERLGRLAWSADEHFVAATHYRGGWYLAVIDIEKGSLRDIAGPWHTIRGFAWTPDGKSILTAAGISATASELFRIDASSGAAERVPTALHTVGNISLTADGKTIATFEPSVSGRVVTFTPGSSERSELLPSVKSGSSPHWCTGGFVAEREIGGSPDLWLLDAHGEPIRQLTSTPDREAELAVSPDGKRIAYTVFSPDGRSSIWLLSLDTRVAVNLTGDVHARRPAFTRDGRSILYSDPVSWWRTMIVSTETRQTKPLLQGITSFAKPSPNGQYLVAATWPRIADWPSYVVLRASDRSVVSTFWMQDAEQFDWLDDETLTFAKPTGADYTIFKVPVRGGEPVAMASFDSKIESYDYDRATQRFLVATIVPSSRAYLLRNE
ncbi:MAG TPA: winged helix-turn-helix domain-containing protein [Thermoanaerobaculia bacterium]|nr:winged helix-turn-helix domain-containing protein [Thermoanaerobaculia bacterium]